MTDVALQCDCGTVTGMARHLSYQNCNRVVCYCNDYQSFPRHLGKSDSVLEQWGGTDLFQMPQAWVTLATGADQLRCLKLSDKGIYRWYTACCNSPIGNTLGPGWPFIGIIHTFMRHEQDRDTELGPSRGNVWVEYAAEGAPESITRAPSSIWLLLRVVRLMLVWKLRGLDQPSVFFSSDGKPTAEPEVLSQNN